jgi:iron complex outermembrane receptor protein/outer membrane receptor for ferrienterochelin and colicins
MKKLIACVSMVCMYALVLAQVETRITVRDSANAQALEGVELQVVGTKLGALTNAQGVATLRDVPAGRQTLRLLYADYRTRSLTVNFPIAELAITLQTIEGDVEVVNITSLRTNSRIEDAPVKIEVLGQGDMNEENTIKPGNIASILGDLSVIQIQQTSPVSGNSAVRLQGLDAKYTQILRDGLPLYDGFSGSFGILQIPPMDLRQIEIIKGSVSTLYGGGAIAGLINVISKDPLPDSTEAAVTISQSNLLETNFNTYVSRRTQQFGFTFFGGINRQSAVDVGNNGYSVVPQLWQYNLHPRLFFYPSDKTTIKAGYQLLAEDRLGGSIAYIRTINDTSFFQRNVSIRHVADAQLQHTFVGGSTLTLKTTFSWFARGQNIPQATFRANNAVSFSEANYVAQWGMHKIVVGLNFTADGLQLQAPDSTRLQNYTYSTVGFFAQDDWSLTHKLTLEYGARYDYHNVYGAFFLPRLAVLYKLQPELVVRLSSGLGYKVPNVFSQQTLSADFRFLQPLAASVRPEQSLGINADLNYRTILGKMVFTLNQSFYYTNIDRPIILSQPTAPFVTLQNAGYVTNSLGTDTYLRGSIEHWEFYLGYNHTIAQHNSSGFNSYVAFSPQDKLSATIFFEKDEWRAGVEAGYIANQYITGNNDNLLQIGSTFLSAAERVPNYWLLAAMVGKTWGKVTVVLNCENLLDIRQQRWSPVVVGSGINPTFRPLWAPIDGRVANLSIRVQI